MGVRILGSTNLHLRDSQPSGVKWAVQLEGEYPWIYTAYPNSTIFLGMTVVSRQIYWQSGKLADPLEWNISILTDSQLCAQNLKLGVISSKLVNRCRNVLSTPDGSLNVSLSVPGHENVGTSGPANLPEGDPLWTVFSNLHEVVVNSEPCCQILYTL